jgi:hypothetical protein
MTRANLSGSGGRSTRVHYATAALFDRMYAAIHSVPNYSRGVVAFANAYQSVTGPGGGSLKRYYNRGGIYRLNHT